MAAAFTCTRQRRRYRFTINRRTRDMGLGPLADLTLAEARERARQCRQLRAKGIDPIEAKRSALRRRRGQTIPRL